ncbi:MAG: Crp/Fnr family transcriptional regulator [Proteobacteria bacterium]|nr:Crp/Fnr family transcriptional regulator [Pseudomonadota bacterium]
MIAIMSNTLGEKLRSLAEREQRLAAGGTLFRLGERVRALYLVAGGLLQLVRALPHGFALTLQRAGPGAFLAEASLFAERYHCDAVATQDSVLRVVSLRRLRNALRDDPDLALALTRHLAHEVQRARAQAETLSLKTVSERVDAWIALNGGALPAKGRWRQVAGEIATSPEALYRELARRR